MSADQEYTYSDVAEHSGKKDLFVVVHDKVYNASSFVDEHPYVFQGRSLQERPIRHLNASSQPRSHTTYSTIEGELQRTPG